MGRTDYARVTVTIERADPHAGFAPEDRLRLGLLACELIAKPMLVWRACKEVGISRDTLHTWCDEIRELSDAYAHARELQAHGFAEEAITIADGLDDDNRDKIQAMVDSWKHLPEESREAVLASLTKEQVNRDRLRVDTRKWFTSKIAPKLYGDLAKREAGAGLGFIAFPEAELHEAREIAQSAFKRIAAASTGEAGQVPELEGYEYVDVDETPGDLARGLDDPDAEPAAPTPTAEAPLARPTKEQEILARRRKGRAPTNGNGKRRSG